MSRSTSWSVRTSPRLYDALVAIAMRYAFLAELLAFLPKLIAFLADLMAFLAHLRRFIRSRSSTSSALLPKVIKLWRWHDRCHGPRLGLWRWGNHGNGWANECGRCRVLQHERRTGSGGVCSFRRGTAQNQRRRALRRERLGRTHRGHLREYCLLKRRQFVADVDHGLGRDCLR